MPDPSEYGLDSFIPGEAQETSLPFEAALQAQSRAANPGAKPAQRAAPPPPSARQIALHRIKLAGYYEQATGAELFDDMNDQYAQIVQREVTAFLEERMIALSGQEAPKAAAQFTDDEVLALKTLAQRLLSPEAPAEEEPEQASPPPVVRPRAPVAAQPPPPPPAPEPPPAPPPPTRRRATIPGKAPVAQPAPRPAPQPAPPAPSPLPPPPAAPTPKRRGRKVKAEAAPGPGRGSDGQARPTTPMPGRIPMPTSRQGIETAMMAKSMEALSNPQMVNTGTTVTSAPKTF